jgi:hypothetical protein
MGYLGFHWSDSSQSGILGKLLGFSFCPYKETVVLKLCFTVACLFGQKPDFKSFLRSPDWLRSDQWKPRYFIPSQWEEWVHPNS